MEKSEPTAPVPKRRWRRAAVTTSVLGGMLLSGMTVLPFAVMNSSHRDRILNEAFEKHGLFASSESGSGSWVSPVVLKNVRIQDQTGRVQCVIAEIRTSHSVFGLLLNGGDLGKITFTEPSVQITLDEDGKLPPGLFRNTEPEKPADQQPELAIDIVDAEFVLSVPWRRLPIVQLENLDISASISNQTDGRWLEISPVQIFDHAEITEANTEQNLALIAPVLSQSTALNGEMSVVMNRTRVQLDKEKRASLQVSGEAVFHTVHTRLKKDWVRQISQMLGRAIGARIPDRLEIVRDSAVQFRVDERGIHHNGLAFLLPELASDMVIQSSGMVGLDETLDLALSLQLPQLAPSNPLMAVFSQMAQLPFTLHVQGTVDSPELVTPPGFSLMDQLARNVNPDRDTSEPPPVTNSVISLIGAAASGNADSSATQITGSVIDIIRAAQKAKENAPPKSPKPPKPDKSLRKKEKKRRNTSI